jgi:hypothetical protein
VEQYGAQEIQQLKDRRVSKVPYKVLDAPQL